MAEYYPLLAKAVAGLPNSTPETRRAIYERARKALLGQLRGIQPPVPQADIDRESSALDNAVARLEKELAAPLSAVDDLEGALKDILAQGVAASAPVVPPSPSAPPRLNTAPALGPASTPRSSAPSMPPLLPRKPLPPEPARKGAEPSTLPFTPSAAVSSAPPASGALTPPRPAFVKPSPPSPRPANPFAAWDEAHAKSQAADAAAPRDLDRPEAAADAPDADVVLAPRSAEATRPPAPSASGQRRDQLRWWLIFGVLAVVAAAIGVFAYVLRDKPDSLARLKQQTNPAAPAEPGGGKIAERVGGGQPSAKSGTPQTEAGAAADPAVPIAYRAALLVEAPDDPQKVKTFVGTVIWRTDNVNSAGQPVGSAVRADIDLPDAKITAAMVIKKNMDATLPASHTIELRFTPAAGGVGGVKQVDLPNMRRDEAPTGDPLGGVVVAITDNFFLVGLSRGDAEARNLDLMNTRGWFDVQLLLSTGKLAKITFEKGATGDRAMGEAIAAWQK